MQLSEVVVCEKCGKNKWSVRNLLRVLNPSIYKEAKQEEKNCINIWTESWFDLNLRSSDGKRGGSHTFIENTVFMIFIRIQNFQPLDYQTCNCRGHYLYSFRLFTGLNCLFDISFSYRQIEGKVVEITKLQEIFAEKVLTQVGYHQIMRFFIIFEGLPKIAEKLYAQYQ